MKPYKIFTIMQTLGIGLLSMGFSFAYFSLIAPWSSYDYISSVSVCGFLVGGLYCILGHLGKYFTKEEK